MPDSLAWFIYICFIIAVMWLHISPEDNIAIQSKAKDKYREASREPSSKEKKKKKKYEAYQELSSYIDLMADINALLILFEDADSVNEALDQHQELVVKRYQLEVRWYRQNGIWEKKNLDLDHLGYSNKIQESFVNCDQWNWSEMKEEDIEQH